MTTRTKDIVISSVSRLRPSSNNHLLGGVTVADTSTPADYQYQLTGYAIKGIKNVQLLQAIVPKTMFPVQTNLNDQVDFTYDGNPFTATLPSRWYADGADLAAELEAQMRAAASATNFTVTYDAGFNRLTLTRTSDTENIALLQQTTTPLAANVIGKAPNDMSTLETGTAAAPQSFNFTGAPDLSWPQALRLKIDPRTDQTTMQSTTSATGKFSYLIPLTVGFGEFAELNLNETFSQSTPIPNVSVDKLRITWEYDLPVPQTGSAGIADLSVLPPVDFRGVDHTLTLRLFC